MHGPEETAFTDLIFTKVEETLNLKKIYNVKSELWMKKDEHQQILKNVSDH